MSGNEQMLKSREVSYGAYPEFLPELNAHEAFMTDMMLTTTLPVCREAGYLEDRLSAISLDSPFAAFIVLPRQWRRKRAPAFEEEFLKRHFPELNINYTYKTSDGIFRFKVFLHYNRESAVYQAVATFDRNAYVFGEFPQSPG
jgi:hypothetical protein